MDMLNLSATQRKDPLIAMGRRCVTLNEKLVYVPCGHPENSSEPPYIMAGSMLLEAILQLPIVKGAFVGNLHAVQLILLIIGTT